MSLSLTEVFDHWDDLSGLQRIDLETGLRGAVDRCSIRTKTLLACSRKDAGQVSTLVQTIQRRLMQVRAIRTVHIPRSIFRVDSRLRVNGGVRSCSYHNRVVRGSPIMAEKEEVELVVRPNVDTEHPIGLCA